MKKENRLLKNKDFKNVLDAKRSVSCGIGIVFVKKNILNHARIGISVSSKIGNSVIRHKVKRQISEIMKEIFDFNNTVDIVIIVRKNFLNNKFAQNKDYLKNLLDKLTKGDKKCNI